MHFCKACFQSYYFYGTGRTEVILEIDFCLLLLVSHAFGWEAAQLWGQFSLVWVIQALASVPETGLAPFVGMEAAQRLQTSLCLWNSSSRTGCEQLSAGLCLHAGFILSSVPDPLTERLTTNPSQRKEVPKLGLHPWDAGEVCTWSAPEQGAEAGGQAAVPENMQGEFGAKHSGRWR